MKISERITADGTRLTVRQTHDWNPVLDQARMLRDAGKGVRGESRLVARIPRKLMVEWAKEAGVSLDDHDAMQDVMARKLNDPAYSQFRVWEGRY